MTSEEFTSAMKDLFEPKEKPRYPNIDIEERHETADKIMCNLLRELGYAEGIDIYEAGDKWYA